MVIRIILLVCFMIFSSVVSGMEYFVAVNGSDDHPGTQQAPFATLLRARDEIRTKKAAGEWKSPVTVYLREGKYVLPETFRLSQQDSGTSDGIITYAAYPGENVILSGGAPLRGWNL